MRVHRESRPPVLAEWLLRAAQALAPSPARDGWREMWGARLENLWILASRGEVRREYPETARLCVDAIRMAFFLRFERGRLLRWMRGPGFAIAPAVASLGLLAMLSRGFQATRSVIHTAIEWKIDPHTIRFDPRADLVVATSVPILLALTVGVVLVAIGRLSVGRYGWRYWLFLASKLISVMVIVPLIWVEGNAALRAHLAVRTLGLAAGWIAWTLAFLGAFGIGVIWVFTDQRRRCPVCLGRLALPVTFGSWASVLEPVTTEMLCDQGHGALSMDENELGPGDRWTALDSSWRGL
jgi:hypothetical protein